MSSCGGYILMTSSDPNYFLKVPFPITTVRYELRDQDPTYEFLERHIQTKVIGHCFPDFGYVLSFEHGVDKIADSQQAVLLRCRLSIVIP